jgi:hypothetical protein
MKTALKWIGDALSPKDIVSGKSFYRVADHEIRATDGYLTAGHPWPSDIEFVVPGEEFEKTFSRMPDEPIIKEMLNGIVIRSGLYHGSINTLSLDKWAYPGVEGATWQKLPKDLLSVLAALRPFVSDNAMQKWATCVALENGWAYATNNVALAGAPCKGLVSIEALLPGWAVDYVIKRSEGLTEWAWTPNYVAFKWKNGAWMRSSLIIGQFPEAAAGMVRKSADENMTQEINDDFRRAFESVASMAEDTIEIYSGHMTAKFKQAEAISVIKCQIPEDSKCSIWGASYLLPAIHAATHWDPTRWPKPAPFKGKIVSGYVLGRRA